MVDFELIDNQLVLVSCGQPAGGSSVRALKNKRRARPLLTNKREEFNKGVAIIIATSATIRILVNYRILLHFQPLMLPRVKWGSLKLMLT